jgi:hypothetical protein
MSADWPPIVLSDEVVGPSRPNVVDEIQQRLIVAEIERHKAALAEVTSPEFAELVYSPETDYLLAVGWKPSR